jgi:hypothetical protein
MLFITPIPAYGRYKINQWIDYYLSTPCSWIRNALFPNAAQFDGFFTDSLNYVILLTFAAILGLFLGLIVQNFRKSSAAFNQFLKSVITYYLAWIFLVYGFSKLFGVQFPLSIEPIGLSELSGENRDFVFWQFMGANQILVKTLGVIEISIASLLFVKNTRKLGLVLFIASVFIILSTNIYFDISVKLFSALLLLAALYVILNYNQVSKHYSPSPFGINLLPIKLFVISALFISGIATAL